MNSIIVSEYFFFYVYPILLLLASVINMLSCLIMIRLRKNNKNSYFTYLLTSNVINSIGCLGAVFWFLSLCGSLCKTSTKYWIVWSRIWINYWTLFAYNWSMFNQISISFSVYFSIMDRLKDTFKVSPWKVNIGNICLSAFFSIVTNIKNQPVQKHEIQVNGQNSTIWVFGRNEIGLTSWYYNLSFSCRVLSYGLSILILIVVNILILIVLKKFQQKRAKIINFYSNSISIQSSYELKRHDSQRKQLVMVLWLSCIFCVSRLIDLCTAPLILTFLLFTEDSVRYIKIFNSILMSINAISYVFVCYVTNSLFKNTLKASLKSLKTFFQNFF